MSAHLGLIAGMALVAYAVRLAGFSLARAPLPGGLEAALRRLPAAVFAALVVVSLPGRAGEGDIRLVAALFAAGALWRTRRPWVGLAVGMAVFWLLRLAEGALGAGG